MLISVQSADINKERCDTEDDHRTIANALAINVCSVVETALLRLIHICDSLSSLSFIVL